MMVDLHALTSHQDPNMLRESSYAGIASYVAAGLNPDQIALFMQSHVTAHAELSWILTCYSYMGELNRMTQFKDKSKKQGQNIPVGLYSYPCLMAADILLYQPHIVPVGDDQKQHIELTRNLAERFNNRYECDVFRIPEPYIPSEGARVMDLQNPLSKMSKSSENEKGVLFLLDTDKKIRKKINSSVTDSGSELKAYEDSSPGIKNLIDINAAMSERSHADVVQEYSGKMYGHLKSGTADIVIEKLAPIREKTNELLEDKNYLDNLLKIGAEKAHNQAMKTLNKVKDLVGLINKP